MNLFFKRAAVFGAAALCAVLCAPRNGAAAMESPSYCATISQSTNPLATRGMVTSPNYLATQAGLDVLRRGGNAGVFASCEALGARRRGERPCAEELFRRCLRHRAGLAAAYQYRVPCRQQL